MIKNPLKHPPLQNRYLDTPKSSLTVISTNLSPSKTISTSCTRKPQGSHYSLDWTTGLTQNMV